LTQRERATPTFFADLALGDFNVTERDRTTRQRQRHAGGDPPAL
jgi:hypothetical protein